MIPAVTLVLLIAILIFVGYPLARAAVPERGRPGDEPLMSQLEQLLAERENALSAIKDLEFEHSIGNLSDGEYEALRGAQRHKAMAILRELDLVGYGSGTVTAVDEPPSPAAPGLDERLEAEIARARQRLSDTVGAATDGTPALCPACHTPYAPGAQFCSACGQPLSPTVACSACGATLARHAAFCSACGTHLEQGSHDG